MNTEDKAKRIVNKLVTDLGDRKGLKQQWDMIEPSVEADICAEWRAIVSRGIREVVEENTKLRSLLQQMLDVAENADETGYVTDVGFVDLDKLHAEVREALKP